MENKIIYDGSINGARLEIRLEREYKDKKFVGTEMKDEKFFVAHLDATYSNGSRRASKGIVTMYQVRFPLFPDVQNAEESWKVFERTKTNMGLPSKIWKDLAKSVGLDESKIDESVSYLKKQMIELLHEKYFSK